MENKKKILVVDDDRFMREMLRVLLTRAGYELVFAEDGAAALELAASEKPDLVLTDALLPKLHGFVVCKTVKGWEEPPKVVLLTAVYTKPTYKWEVKKEYGADDILNKPCKSEELVTCIRKHLRQECADDSSPCEAARLVVTVLAQAASSGAEFATAGVGCDQIMCDVEVPSPLTAFAVVPAA